MIRHRRSALTQRGMVFCSGGITLALGGLILGYADIARVGVLLALLPFLSMLYGRRRPAAVTVSRRVEPALLQPDQRAQVTVTFRNASRRSSHLYLAEESLDYVLGDRPRFLLPTLSPGAARRLTYVVRSPARGRRRLGPVRLREVDPFGLTSAELEIRSVDEVLVLPRIVDLPASRPPGVGTGSEGEIPQMVALHGADDVTIRAYHDGDDLRKVHWPATAHRGELMVRQDEQPARRSALVLVDARACAHEGTGMHSSFEWAVSAAASIAVRLHHLAYSVHLATPETAASGAIDRPEAASAVLRQLAVADLCSDDAHRTMVARAHDVVRLGAIVVAVITDRDDAASAIVRMRRTGAGGIAFVLDTRSFADHGASEGSTAGSLRAQLAAAGWRVLVVRHDTSIADAWEAVAARSLLRVGAL